MLLGNYMKSDKKVELIKKISLLTVIGVTCF